MATCQECKAYQPVDDAQGTCFGHIVSANADAGECPADAYQPKEA